MAGMPESDLRALIKRVVELSQPNLRKYLRQPRRGEIVKSYRVDSRYVADVRVLTNDGSPDSDEPEYPRLDLPVVWGGDKRGMICPPENGTPCVVGYLDGDPNFPFIQHIFWKKGSVPSCELDEFIIQLDADTSIKIDKEKKIITISPEEIRNESKKKWVVVAEESVSVEAPTVSLKTDKLVVSSMKDGAEATAQETVERRHTGNQTTSGTVTASLFVGELAMLQTGSGNPPDASSVADGTVYIQFD